MNLPEITSVVFFIFIPHNCRLHYIQELWEAGYSVITASVFVYQANTVSAYACSAAHLQGRSERRHQHTPSSMSQKISALFFLSFFFLGGDT